MLFWKSKWIIFILALELATVMLNSASMSTKYKVEDVVYNNPVTPEAGAEFRITLVYYSARRDYCGMHTSVNSSISLVVKTMFCHLSIHDGTHSLSVHRI